MDRKKEISHEEVSNILRMVIDGRIPKSDVDDLSYINWWEVNEPSVKLGLWEFTFFIEARWIYDVYEVEAPDGRISEFTPRDGDSKMELFLTNYEVVQLCKILGCPLTEGEINAHRPQA